MSEVKNHKYTQTLDEAVRTLVSTRHASAGSLVTMPVMYPSGSAVVLEVSMNGKRCFVSDMGTAFEESQMMGSNRYFKSEANRIAERYGIKFDGQLMFVAEVPIENIQGALVVVANASGDAARAAANKQTERHEHDAKEMLYERLLSVYRTKDVAKDAEAIGQSNHRWKISVLVKDSVNTWMFEPVSGFYITAVGTAAKFHDFAALESPPSRISVIKSRDDIGDFYGLVAGASTKIVYANEPDSTFERLLEAA
jgi:hypothetical protein